MPRKKSWRCRALDEDIFEDDEASGGGDAGVEKPVQRNAANARERARMRVLSKAFCRLKTTLPWVPADTKLSKLDTLRLATSYIAHLRSVLCLPDDEDYSPPDKPSQPVHPLNLTWPYSFQFHVNNGSNSSSCSADDWKQRELKSRERVPETDVHYSQNRAAGNPSKFRPHTPPAPGFCAFSDAPCNPTHTHTHAFKFKSEDMFEGRSRRYPAAYPHSVFEPSKRLYLMGEEKS
ncbi:unnamed protein product [Bemisia tabaci]|uniref:BHLH domain-containing protein n=1 Tax=Bemisia tabaci TaxID=7038 RepID=A0A9P0AH30_BEMTA|nr:unnamed protein product [Bemisia tabaci]